MLTPGGELNTIPVQERQVYDLLCQAARLSAVCPTNLDIEMLLGYESASTGPVMVARLEKRGLIRVERYQRFRIIEICATGERTARSPSMHTQAVHVPRGARSSHPVPTNRKAFTKGRV